MKYMFVCLQDSTYIEDAVKSSFLAEELSHLVSDL